MTPTFLILKGNDSRETIYWDPLDGKLTFRVTETGALVFETDSELIVAYAPGIWVSVADYSWASVVTDWIELQEAAQELANE